MLKTMALIAYAGLVVGVVVLWLMSKFAGRAAVVTGTLSDVGGFVAALRDAGSTQSFLIIAVAGREDFLQMKYLDGKFEVDFPLVTERQRQLEGSIREIYRGFGLEIHETSWLGSKESDFLDVVVDSDDDVATIVREVFVRAFGTHEDTWLDYTCSGFEHATA